MFSKEMPLLPVHFESVTFTVEEFHRVLEATTIENGYDSSKKRNRYREWLPTAFKLGLHICLRLDELVNLKYCNIIENGGLIFLQGVNRKATNLIDDDQVERIKRVPVIPELYKVLNEECEFEELKGENIFDDIHRQLSTVTALRAVILSWGGIKEHKPESYAFPGFPFSFFHTQASLY